jgi:hypothetical protein
MVTAAMMLMLVSAAAQQGQNAVMDSGNHPQASPSFLDATQFAGSPDACLQIQHAFATLPSMGGTVDARGLIPSTGSTIVCSVNPIPSGAKGRLLLSTGTYLAQVPWVIQNNDLNVVGTGGGGGTNTIIQACAAGQSNCGGVVFPSGQGIIQLGPTAGGTAISRVTVKELGVDCQDVPGVSGVQAIAAQEETVAPGPWKQLAELTEAKGKESDWLGWSVAISKDGDTAAVGAVGWCPQQGFDGCGQGAIFVFVKPASGWADMTQTALLTASDGQPGEYLGESVAISDDGSTIVAGAPGWPANGHDNGALYVFVKPTNGWVDGTESARMTSTDTDTGLGQSIGMSGRVVVGGAEYFNGGQGAAYVFVEPTTGWANRTQTARLTPSDGKGGAMGDSVSISGDTVVAGAPVSGASGAGNGAYLFVKPKNGWKNKTENAKLTPSGGTRLGYSVSISGSTVAVGARFWNNGEGAVYVYVKPVQGWQSMTETARLTVPLKFNLLGYSVSVDDGGNDIVGGAPGWQDGVGQGAAVLFVKPTAGWKTTSKFKTRLTAADGRAQDGLGYSVSANPLTIVAGAPGATIGSNPKEGAAYVFGQ